MEFIEIFTEMHWVPALLLILGALFMLVETFIPDFGFFGISGIVTLIVGVIVRICMGLNLGQSLTLILIVIGFFAVSFLIMVYGAQYGILGKTGLFERSTTLAQDYNEPERRIRKLVGKNGRAITNLDLAGKAKIRGKIYDVVSINTFITEGSHVKVVDIKDNSIMVRKWFE